MAERTARRAGSRRTTPQPAPQTGRVGTHSPPNRTTRITRSQSRDISDSEERRNGFKARKGAEQAIPDATTEAVEQSGPQTRKGRPTNHTRAQQGRVIHPRNCSASSQSWACLVYKRLFRSIHRKPSVWPQDSYFNHATNKY